MEREEIRRTFLDAEEAWMKAQKIVEGYYMPLCREALGKKDFEAVDRLIQDCPDDLTRVFMMDARRQARL